VNTWDNERMRPAPYHRRHVESEVAVPVLQAGVIAVALAVLVSTVIGVLCVIGELPTRELVAFPALVGVLVLLVSFLGLAWRGFALRRVLWLAEAGLGVDIDGDGVRGRPGRREPIIVRSVARAGEGSDRGDDGEGELPRPAVDNGRADLYRFLLRCYTVGVSRASLVTRPRLRLPSGQRVTRTVYDGYMATLEAAGIAVNGDGSGWSLAVDIDEAMAACGLVGLWTSEGRPGQVGGQVGGQATGEGSRRDLRVVG